MTSIQTAARYALALIATVWLTASLLLLVRVSADPSVDPATLSSLFTAAILSGSLTALLAAAGLHYQPVEGRQ
jgi:hypothetical protein